MSNPHRSAALVLFLTAGLAGVCSSTARADTTDLARQFETAMERYERNHWVEAYAQLAQLADQEHAEAARIAGQMLTYGPALYGTRFTATLVQSQRWAMLSKRQPNPGR